MRKYLFVMLAGLCAGCSLASGLFATPATVDVVKMGCARAQGDLEGQYAVLLKLIGPNDVESLATAQKLHDVVAEALAQCVAAK